MSIGMNIGRDMNRAKRYMGKYTGDGFAHIAVIAKNGGERKVSIGGNVMLLGGCVAELISCIAKDSGLGQSLVDDIYDAATFLVGEKPVEKPPEEVPEEVPEENKAEVESDA